MGYREHFEVMMINESMKRERIFCIHDADDISRDLGQRFFMLLALSKHFIRIITSFRRNITVNEHNEPTTPFYGRF